LGAVTTNPKPIPLTFIGLSSGLEVIGTGYRVGNSSGDYAHGNPHLAVYRSVIQGALNLFRGCL